jgi:hypothetical protein
MWGFTTVVAAFMAAFFLAALMWGGAALPLVLPVAAIALAVAAWMDFRRRRARTKQQKMTREGLRAESNSAEFNERGRQTL